MQNDPLRSTRRLAALGLAVLTGTVATIAALWALLRDTDIPDLNVALLGLFGLGLFVGTGMLTNAAVAGTRALVRHPETRRARGVTLVGAIIIALLTILLYLLVGIGPI
ncbi:MAG TPA: hypothetical protein VFW03_26730 [Gemmatimonadaceae bacterium]|nr:hypothetical protein [Gemmatimonadaceae bacterium]